jgi:hypothetical protein
MHFGHVDDLIHMPEPTSGTRYKTHVHQGLGFAIHERRRAKGPWKPSGYVRNVIQQPAVHNTAQLGYRRMKPYTL